VKVYITQKLSSIAETLLKANKINYEVFPKDRPITKKELIKNAKDADAVISLLTDKIDKEVIDSLSNCKVIANFAVGYNNIDVQYANSKNIIVTNTPDTLTDSTADLAITLILACARRLFESEKFLRAGKYKTWKPELLLGYELKNKTLGIIGAGRIGQATAKRAASFGMEILYFNKSKKEKFEEELKAKKVSLNQLMKLSDFISVHLPLNLKTFHILNDKNLKLVKKNSIIVNTSRGEIIDEKALLNLLKKNKNYIAGLDVFENEPFINKKLLKYKNVVILPHIGSATIEARTAMAKLATENVISVLKFKKPLNPVMF